MRKKIMVQYSGSNKPNVYVELEVPENGFDLPSFLVETAVDFHKTEKGKRKCQENNGFTAASIILDFPPEVQKKYGVQIKKKIPVDMTINGDFVFWNDDDFAFYEKYVGGQMDFVNALKKVVRFAQWWGMDSLKSGKELSMQELFGLAEEYMESPEADERVFYENKKKEHASICP